jgi:hypothetical protein
MYERFVLSAKGIDFAIDFAILYRKQFPQRINRKTIRKIDVSCVALIGHGIHETGSIALLKFPSGIKTPKER